MLDASLWASRWREAALMVPVIAMPMIGYHEQPPQPRAGRAGAVCVVAVAKIILSPSLAAMSPPNHPCVWWEFLVARLTARPGRSRNAAMASTTPSATRLWHGAAPRQCGVEVPHGRGSSTGGPSRRLPHDECTKGSITRRECAAHGTYFNTMACEYYLHIIHKLRCILRWYMYSTGLDPSELRACKLVFSPHGAPLPVSLVFVD